MDREEEGEETVAVGRCVLWKKDAKYKPCSAVSDRSEIEPEESEDELPLVEGVVKTSKSEPHLNVSHQTVSESDFVRYPGINDTEVLTCECSNHACQKVFWFRTLHNNLDIQFLLSLNNAGRTSHEASVDEHRFQASKRDTGSKMTFTLRLINIRSEDAGLYTCMLQNQKENKLWRPGVLLRPGETRPTLLPITKPQPQGIPNSTPNGRCTKGNYQTPKASR
ncbi:uncharacterized protein LOC120064835 [Salvelinus namaycush]|uniref:Uncharacterized protein LOC120064835 n=1 Tax=Salvelinus namaycush TaxID=8040 RepID=A0A8U1F8S1_SALNM|nr:uncharacterized protein LOC120064835 [Salvelinus namaycush]